MSRIDRAIPRCPTHRAQARLTATMETRKHSSDSITKSDMSGRVGLLESENTLLREQKDFYLNLSK